jgi:hypothetical protein
MDRLRRASELCCVAAFLALAYEPVAAAPASTPDFSGLWARTSLGYEKPANGQGGVDNRMRRPNGASNLSQLVGDYNDPLLKPRAAEVLKHLGEISMQNIAFPQPSNQCLPYPPPYIASNNQEIQLLQEKDRVTILTMFDHQYRHVRLNAQHPAKLTPSWYGDSVGHYEGDTLVVDTVGIRVTPLSMVDIYGTPFSTRLHVIEKFRLVDYATAKSFADRGEAENGRVAGDNGDGVELDLSDRGKGLQLEITVEDPEMFTRPWTGTVTYRRPLGAWAEMVCAENTHEYYAGRETTIPVALKPDF